jgi:hypothetical protein
MAQRRGWTASTPCSARSSARADQAVVDAVRQGDKIESITIEGDYSALFDKARPQLDQWNAVLDKR